MSTVSLLPHPDHPEDTAYSDRPTSTVKTELRVLTPDEVLQLQPVFDRADAVTPDPNTSFVIGILEDGKPTESFLVVQAVLHGEPLNIEPRHRMYLKSLVHYAEREVVSRCGVRNVFIFTPENEIKQLAELLGWTAQPWRVLSKIVGPTGEPS